MTRIWRRKLEMVSLPNNAERNPVPGFGESGGDPFSRIFESEPYKPFKLWSGNYFFRQQKIRTAFSVSKAHTFG